MSKKNCSLITKIRSLFLKHYKVEEKSLKWTTCSAARWKMANSSHSDEVENNSPVQYFLKLMAAISTFPFKYWLYFINLFQMLFSNFYPHCRLFTYEERCGVQTFVRGIFEQLHIEARENPEENFDSALVVSIIKRWIVMKTMMKRILIKSAVFRARDAYFDDGSFVSGFNAGKYPL